MTNRFFVLFKFLSLVSITSTAVAEPGLEWQELEQQELEDLKAWVKQLEQQATNSKPAPEAKESIRLGGALRFQYSHREYDRSNEQQGGVMELDTLRLNLDGEIGGMILSAEYRHYDYMDVIHHAWVGYQFSPTVIGRAGIIKVPFGNQPYNSNNFFFSSNYYLGLEDDYDLGLGASYQGDAWQADLALLKNDERGGSDSYSRYSYDLVGVRGASEGINDRPAQVVTETNTLVGRVVRHWSTDGFDLDVGASALYGSLYDHNSGDDDGDYQAWAAHLDADWQRWNLKLQVSQYDYSFAEYSPLMAVGAYAFYDTIAAEATTLTAGIARTIDWHAGPIDGITIYSDFSEVRNKSGGLPNTWMNVTGVAISAGPVYTYIDWVTARNHPFIGGSMGDSNSGSVNHRLNINVGYYF